MEALESQFGNDKILIKGRLFPNWIANKYDEMVDRTSFDTDIISFFKGLNEKQVKAVKGVKGNKEATKEQKFSDLLNEYYQEYESSKQAA